VKVLQWVQLPVSDELHVTASLLLAAVRCGLAVVSLRLVRGICCWRTFGIAVCACDGIADGVVGAEEALCALDLIRFCRKKQASQALPDDKVAEAAGVFFPALFQYQSLGDVNSVSEGLGAGT